MRGGTVIVTGGASGIGRGIATRLAEEGAAVGLIDRDTVGLKEAVSEIDRLDAEAVGHAADVSRREEVAEAFSELEETLGSATGLVTAAGILLGRTDSNVLAVSEESWSATLAVNLSGTFNCAQEFTRRCVRSGQAGSIVTVSSIGAARPSVGNAAYHASKGGVVSLTRALAVNLACLNIRVNCLAPGYIATPMTVAVDDDEELRNAVIRRIPLGRMGTPRDIAGCALFLLSDDAAYVTGQVLYVDGGALILGWTDARYPSLGHS